MRSDELECPSCHTPLELSRSSRVLGGIVGLIAAYFLARLALDSSPGAAWFLPVVAAVVGYGFGSALFLYFLSDVTVRPKAEASHFPHIHR
jgi:phage shock protein PspC (stress-responsive transcriptional regulator)